MVFADSTMVITHSPIALPNASALLRDAFVWALLELLIWTAILVSSERRLPLLESISYHVEHSLGILTRRRFLAVTAVFAVVLFGRLALLPIAPAPPPKIVDEFSQLLSADTFASGRLTNPTHPMWFYFETLFVNEKPTYHSMYPPATGLVMAIAQVLTGQPWYGMLFTVAAASAAMCWMLQGWLPARWGLWGTVVFVLLAARDQLTENYLGEGIIVLGGALILGAVPRIVKKHNIGDSIWLGIGIALLATTRPYEGAFLVSGTGLGAFYWARKTGLNTATLFKSVASPVAVILIPVFLMAGYLNWRTTGNAMVAPYQLNLAQQHITRPLVWQDSQRPQYDHAAIESFYEQWELNWSQRTRGFPRGTALLLADKASMTYQWIVWPLAVLVAAGIFQLLKSKTRRFVPLAFGLFLVGLSLETYPVLPRYVESAWSLVILLAVYGLRSIRVWRRSSRQGLRICTGAMLLIPLALFLFDGMFHYVRARSGSDSETWYVARYQISGALESLPAKQLVIVRYSPSHVPSEEWVYNRADIDSAKVVWARDVEGRDPADLLRYFAGRRIWVLEPDGKVPKITSYSVDCRDSTVTGLGPFHVDCCDSFCNR